MASARIALAIWEVGAGDGVVMSSPENESKKRGAGAVRKLGGQSAPAHDAAPGDAKRAEQTDKAAKRDILADRHRLPGRKASGAASFAIGSTMAFVRGSGRETAVVAARAARLAQRDAHGRL